MTCIALSNNDIAIVAWTFDKKLTGCLGFQVERGDANAGTWSGLPAMARFPNDTRQGLTTHDAPIQKFWWKDLYARRGGTFQYRVTPMTGNPGGALQPMAGVAPLVSNPVTITHDRGLFRAFFNRGFVSSQAVVNKLGSASVPRLLRHVADPADPLRAMLTGELESGVLELLDRADAEHGEIRGALYELNDPKGLEVRLQAADHGDPGSRAIVLGNARISADKEKGTPENADGDSANREALKHAGVNVVDRILPDQHIPHNKFLVLKEQGNPKAVLTGSTNWTSTGLCTQTNNALIIESPAVAAEYAAYWDQLEKDSNASKMQGAALRTWCGQHNEKMLGTPVALEDGSATVQVLFSPNTKSALSKTNADDAKDMAHVRELMLKAKGAVLFLAFDPGNHSILDFAGEALSRNSKLFVRGALTSPARAANFAEALQASSGDPDVPKSEIGIVSSAGDATQTKSEPDYRAIPATAVNATDAFGAWHAEIHSAGHAIIHDKIVVIDPFDPDCVVITGSHNLGARASHNNDENFVVVQGHRPLAEAYACHVLDVYDHFAWRWWLAKDPSTFGRPLAINDAWQDTYIKGDTAKSPELAFWLDATPSTDVHRTSRTGGGKPQPAMADAQEEPVD